MSTRAHGPIGACHRAMCMLISTLLSKLRGAAAVLMLPRLYHAPLQAPDGHMRHCIGAFSSRCPMPALLA